MHGAPAMLILTPTITLFAAITVVVVGSLILWSNPRRAVNRVVFSCSLHLALWLACLHLARTPGLDGLFWVRFACVVGASVPIHFWLVLHGALATEHVASVGHFLRRNLVWIAITLIR